MGTTTSKPDIREATSDDALRVRDIARSAYGKYVVRIGREPAPMGADYENQIADKLCVVLLVADRVCGYLIAWPEANAYFIENIGVDPVCQGEGFGHCLMDYATDEARRLRLPAVRLYTNALMTENLAMYARLGFVETHRVRESGFDRVYMQKTL